MISVRKKYMTLLEKWPILSGFVCGLFQKISKICPDWYVASSAIVRGPLVELPLGKREIHEPDEFFPLDR